MVTFATKEFQKKNYLLLDVCISICKAKFSVCPSAHIWRALSTDSTDTLRSHTGTAARHRGLSVPPLLYLMSCSLFCSFSLQICSPSTLPHLYTFILISLMWSRVKSFKNRKGNGTEKRREGAILKYPPTHSPTQKTAPSDHSLLQSLQHTHNLLAPFLKDVGTKPYIVKRKESDKEFVFVLLNLPRV